MSHIRPGADRQLFEEVKPGTLADIHTAIYAEDDRYTERKWAEIIQAINDLGDGLREHNAERELEERPGEVARENAATGRTCNS